MSQSPPRFSTTSFKALVERVDPTTPRKRQPDTYFFSGGRRKKDAAVPFYARS